MFLWFLVCFYFPFLGVYIFIIKNYENKIKKEIKFQLCYLWEIQRIKTFFNIQSLLLFFMISPLPAHMLLIDMNKPQAFIFSDVDCLNPLKSSQTQVKTLLKTSSIGQFILFSETTRINYNIPWTWGFIIHFKSNTPNESITSLNQKTIKRIIKQFTNFLLRNYPNIAKESGNSHITCPSSDCS